MAKRRVHYVLSTHWDREWYQTFQDFRFRLVKLMDEILDGLEEGRLRGPFQTDGQAIILEDYLEVRPERREQVERYAREGKLVIGPWYVLPDEFLVSGESMIRNIRLGRDVARSFGTQPSNAGFVCDIFGHNSQLPQLFAGFGIPGGFIWRGVNLFETRQVRWIGADGTELPCYRFGKVGYCSYALQVRHAVFGGFRPFDKEFHRAELEAYLQEEASATETDTILFFDGCDHQPWDQEMYALLQERAAQEDASFEIVHTSLDDYLADMLPQANRISTVLSGELREPARHSSDLDGQWLIPGVLSSRVWIKQDNADCQTLLCHWAEPFGALAHTTLGTEYPQGFLNVAWKWLLKNHPHDSICGCSIDAVHEDMKFRFSQCRNIANRQTIEATTRMAASIEGELEDEALRVVAFNPLTSSFQETAELTVRLPKDWPTFNEFFGFEPKPAFRLYGPDGTEIPYQRLAQAMHRVKGHEITVSAPLQIPPTGYTALTVRRGEPAKPTRYPEVPGLATSERSMANEYLDVTIESNGTLTVTDKRTDKTYNRLLTFEECADIGDGWYHGVAVNDQVFASSACQADVALVHNGPMLTTFRIRTTMRVPDSFHFDTMTRAETFTEMVLDSTVSLRPGVDRIEVQTTAHNTADDHRLRVLFPSGAQTGTYLADSAFDVVERPIALRADNHLYRELEIEPKPQESWTAVHDTDRGLAVLSSGLLESAVRDLPERPIALTLFRGTRRTVMTDGEPNGQLRGTLVFRYWIVPLSGAPDRPRLFTLAKQLAAGLRTVQLSAAEIGYQRVGNIPATAGFVQVEGPGVVTSLRYVGEKLEVRLFNPTTADGQATVRFLQPELAARFRTFQSVNLESTPLGEPQPCADGTATVLLHPKQIVTLSFA